MAISIYFYSFLQGPPNLTNDQNTVIYDHDTKVIGVKHGEENRYWVPIEEISPYVKEAFLATEDRNFYDHVGFDFKRIIGAAVENVIAMNKVEGASTITQQYARNLYLNHEKTWTRKWKEALYAIRLEMFYEKDEIFEGYLNTIYFGHGNYGIEAASRFYFQKEAENLTLSEAALLASIPKGPSLYSPITNLERAMNRQQMILTMLKNIGKINQQQYEQAKQAEIVIARNDNDEGRQIAPYFQDVVLHEAEKLLNISKNKIRTSGYNIYTTLDVRKQEELERVVEETIDEASTIQVGAVSMNPETGSVEALIGGRDYEKSPYNRAVQATRMAGSTFKPFLYYSALKHGYTPATALESKPTHFQLEDGSVYQPSNYNGYYAYSPITLAQALALSDNIYAVKTNLFLNPERLVETAHEFGIERPLPAVPSLALGTASVTVMDMASSYSMMANYGKKVTPHTITKITDASGTVLYERKIETKQVLDERYTFVLSHLMTGIFDEALNGYSRVTGAAINDQLTREYAGKSGTTNTDSWMVGFSPQIVTAVWTGYDMNEPLNQIREQVYAKEIWAQYMERAHKPLPKKSFIPPDGVTPVYMDPQTGKLATNACPTKRLTYFIEGTEPRILCEEHNHKGIEEKIEDQHQVDNETKQNKEKGWRSWFDWLF
ncbi:PBP1A family penicillin-binding protein [Salirhabdus salicampi]|nr:PBP1A family penicillin-binding protein [Salirhabdus salicampi]MCP8617395.1 PBP1A family penicillin-binding protein [Salirhabdus salicampi]